VAILKSINWAAVRQHYDERVTVSENLRKLYKQNAVDKFADLALGITNVDGNYSSAEHGLGPRILNFNANPNRRVFKLAGEFMALADARRVPELIRRAQLKYLGIGVGSEISCMVNPHVCWIANTRTIWTHLLIKHADNIAKADEELKLYREADAESEMAYAMWAEIHSKLDVALIRIAELGSANSKQVGIKFGDIKYLWADAIASHLYGTYHPR
jgi:hypothetical protein